ncbi:hypothetical protein HW555_000430 [Spodoptera exigua]|uniref:Uncharacterized protein n=1 Tax=Spodoptera exigua TaxID=7107 RepID=A0A835GR39_SPOEX|nr:hypothetical protein HW555_000430 [Spodoptera exigua]
MEEISTITGVSLATIKRIKKELRDTIGFTGSRETLRRILHDNGYEFKKNSNERSLLIEKSENVAWRRRMLGKIINILFTLTKLTNQKSLGKVLLSVMTDYHLDMNAVNFKKSLCEKFILNLEKPNIVVMDTASYHTCQNKAPTTQTRRNNNNNSPSKTRGVARTAGNSTAGPAAESSLQMEDNIFEYWVGLTKENFNILLEEVSRISLIKRGSLGLAALLLKMRTGDSDDRISTLLKVPRRTLESLTDKVREVLLQDFVSAHLGISHLSRDELLRHNLLIPNGLYGNACDGYIVDCYGPYKAITSDADIMSGLFSSENSALRSYFRQNDVFILDREFRDCISLLEGCGYRTCMPESL